MVHTVGRFIQFYLPVRAPLPCACRFISEEEFKAIMKHIWLDQEEFARLHAEEIIRQVRSRGTCHVCC